MQCHFLLSLSLSLSLSVCLSHTHTLSHSLSPGVDYICQLQSGHARLDCFCLIALVSISFAWISKPLSDVKCPCLGGKIKMKETVHLLK